MEIQIRQKCSECSSVKWTTNMSSVYYCEDCIYSTRPCCPVCLKTEVKYICVSRNNVNHIDVIECFDKSCLYASPDSEDEDVIEEADELIVEDVSEMVFDENGEEIICF